MIKKITKIFIFLFFLAITLLFLQVNVKAQGDGPQVDVSIVATIDGDNNKVTLRTGKAVYGSKLVPNFDLVQGTFAFWIVDGVVTDLDKETEFTATNDFNAVAVFYNETESFSVYVDHNGKLLEAFYDVEEPNPTEPDKIGYQFKGWQEVSGLEDYVKVYKATYSLDHDDVKVNGEDTRYNSVVSLTGDEDKVWVKDDKVVSYNQDYAFSALKNTIVSQRELEVDEVAESLVTIEVLEGYREDYTTYLVQVELLEGTLVEYGLEVDGTLKKASAIHKTTNEFLISSANEFSSVRAYVVVEKESGYEYLYSDFTNYITDAQIVYDFSGITDKGTSINAEGLTTLLEHDYLLRISEASNVTKGNSSGSTNYLGFNGLIKTGTSSAEGNITFEFKGNVLIDTVVLYVAAWNDTTKSILVNGESIADSIDAMESRVVVKLPKKTNRVTYKTAKQGLLFGIEFYGEEASIIPANQINVTFDYNDDNQTDSVIKSIFKNRKVFAPANPTWEGYEFLGWFEDLQDEESFDFSSNISSNLTLYGKWEELEEGNQILIITQTSFSNLSSSYDNGATKSAIVDGIGFETVYAMRNSTNIQGQKDNFNLYNIHCFGVIDTIKVEVTGAALNEMTVGFSRDAIDTEVEGVLSNNIYTYNLKGDDEYTFFNLKAKATIYIVKIEITYKELNEIDKVDTALEILDINYHGQNPQELEYDISLPLGGAFGASVSWVSSLPQVISNTGNITRDDNVDKEVTLTATLNIGEVFDTKQFIVTVKKESPPQKKNIVFNTNLPEYPTSYADKNFIIEGHTFAAKQLTKNGVNIQGNKTQNSSITSNNLNSIDCIKITISTGTVAAASAKFYVEIANNDSFDNSTKFCFGSGYSNATNITLSDGTVASVLTIKNAVITIDVSSYNASYVRFIWQNGASYFNEITIDIVS